MGLSSKARLGLQALSVAGMDAQTARDEPLDELPRAYPLRPESDKLIDPFEWDIIVITLEHATGDAC